MDPIFDWDGQHPLDIPELGFFSEFLGDSRSFWNPLLTRRRRKKRICSQRSDYIEIPIILGNSMASTGGNSYFCTNENG